MSRSSLSLSNYIRNRKTTRWSLCWDCDCRRINMGEYRPAPMWLRKCVPWSDVTTVDFSHLVGRADDGILITFSINSKWGMGGMGWRWEIKSTSAGWHEGNASVCWEGMETGIHGQFFLFFLSYLLTYLLYIHNLFFNHMLTCCHIDGRESKFRFPCVEHAEWQTNLELPLILTLIGWQFKQTAGGYIQQAKLLVCVLL